ncbi:MAG: aminopeptidase C [Candidatus Aminicenantia bacterium]
MRKIKKIYVFLIALLLLFPLYAQKAKKEEPKDKPVHVFKISHEVKRTPVKDQYKTGTCWVFATISFLESELLREGKGEFDLSEMFIVRHVYPQKALNYIRNHGKANFSPGGQAHDVIETIKKFGIVLESVYSGMKIGESKHNHGELHSVLHGMLDGILKLSGGKITPVWMDAFETVLDVYLGKPPSQFEYNGKSYTPRSFFEEVIGLDLNNYFELTSYNHHPFYQKIRLEIPDNWMNYSDYYNLPIDELEETIDYAIKKGYSVVWDGDVTEREFSAKTGYTVVPIKEWEEKTQAERDAKITEPEPEKEVDQEMRQKTFDNFTTTDDHLMHIVGIAYDQKGTKFYLTKNSGGTDRAYGGYVYMSRSYVRLKTVAIMVHRDSIPPEIAKKLGIK